MGVLSVGIVVRVLVGHPVKRVEKLDAHSDKIQHETG